MSRIQSIHLKSHVGSGSLPDADTRAGHRRIAADQDRSGTFFRSEPIWHGISTAKPRPVPPPSVAADVVACPKRATALRWAGCVADSPSPASSGVPPDYHSPCPRRGFAWACSWARGAPPPLLRWSPLTGDDRLRWQRPPPRLTAHPSPRPASCVWSHFWPDP